MKKGLVVILMTALLVFSLIGCSNQNNTSDKQEEIEALQSEIEGLRAQLDEKEEEKGEGEEEIEALQSEIESLRAQLDEKGQDEQTIQENTTETQEEKDVVEEVDYDKVYDAIEEFTVDNRGRISNVLYWKCVLLNDDDIPEVLLFDGSSRLYAIICVDEDYKVTYNGINNGSNNSNGINNLHTQNMPSVSGSDSISFYYNPKQSSFECGYINTIDSSHEYTTNGYFELSEGGITEAGYSEKRVQSDGVLYAAGKFWLGQATKEIYDEYNSDFTYTESFVVKDACRISLEAAFNEFMENN